MRLTNTYRHARRNSLRVHKPRSKLRHWGLGGAAIIANNVAKLSERAKQCAAANAAVKAALAEEFSVSTGTPRVTIVRRALREFWNTQPRTNVVQRILRELREKMKVAR